MGYMQPAIFLDRDGVIIENIPTYVRSYDDVKFIPQAIDALVKASSSPYKIVLITNQSAVGRGIISTEEAWAINDTIVEHIQEPGGRIDGTFMCPHDPLEGCNCRKPKPGLILQAAEDLDIDLQTSILIGDAISDLLAGQAAKVGQLALVRTGRGASQEKHLSAYQLKPFRVYDTLESALSDLIKT